MAELSAGLATLSLFLAWRLYVVSTRLIMANHMLKGIMMGKVVITQTEDGVEMEIKENV